MRRFIILLAVCASAALAGYQFPARYGAHYYRWATGDTLPHGTPGDSVECPIWKEVVAYVAGHGGGGGADSTKVLVSYGILRRTHGDTMWFRLDTTTVDGRYLGLHRRADSALLSDTAIFVRGGIHDSTAFHHNDTLDRDDPAYARSVETDSVGAHGRVLYILSKSASELNYMLDSMMVKATASHFAGSICATAGVYSGATSDTTTRLATMQFVRDSGGGGAIPYDSAPVAATAHRLTAAYVDWIGSGGASILNKPPIPAANDSALVSASTHLYPDSNTTNPTCISATRFRGALIGNVTGNVTGSSGSCTGNAGTASNAAQLQTLDTTALKSRSLAVGGTAANASQLQTLDTTALKSRSLAVGGTAANASQLQTLDTTAIKSRMPAAYDSSSGSARFGGLTLAQVLTAAAESSFIPLIGTMVPMEDSIPLAAHLVLCNGTAKFKDLNGDSVVTKDYRNIVLVGADIDTLGHPATHIGGGKALATGGSVSYTPAGGIPAETWTGDTLTSHTHGVGTYAVGAIAASADPAQKVGTAGSTVAPSNHTHPAPSFTGTSSVSSQVTPTGHNGTTTLTGTTTNIMPPYRAAYWAVYSRYW